MQLNATGQATQLGEFTLDMPHCVDFSTPPPTGSGYFVLTAANGDTVYGRVDGQSFPTQVPGIVHGVERMTILGGTGRFANASGSFRSDRLIDTVNFVTAGTFEGTISAPGAGDR